MKRTYLQPGKNQFRATFMFSIVNQAPFMFARLALVLGAVLQVLAVSAEERSLAVRDAQYIQTGATNGASIPDLSNEVDVTSGGSLNTAILSLLNTLASEGSAGNVWNGSMQDSSGYYVHLFYNPAGGDNAVAAFQSYVEAPSTSVTGSFAGDIISEMENIGSAAVCADIYNDEGWMGPMSIVVTNAEDSGDNYGGLC